MYNLGLKQSKYERITNHYRRFIDVKKFVKNSINGFTSEVGNVNNLSKKIRILVDKPQLRKKFGKKSRQISKNKLDIKICGKLHLKAYKDIAN